MTGTSKASSVDRVVLQRWRCMVLDVESDVVNVEMIDETDPSNPNEYAEIWLSQFTAEQQMELRACIDWIWQVGSVQEFSWEIGYERKPSGQIVTFSQFELSK